MLMIVARLSAVWQDMAYIVKDHSQHRYWTETSLSIYYHSF